MKTITHEELEGIFKEDPHITLESDEDWKSLSDFMPDGYVTLQTEGEAISFFLGLSHLVGSGWDHDLETIIVGPTYEDFYKERELIDDMLDDALDGKNKRYKNAKVNGIDICDVSEEIAEIMSKYRDEDTNLIFKFFNEMMAVLYAKHYMKTP